MRQRPFGAFATALAGCLLLSAGSVLAQDDAPCEDTTTQSGLNLCSQRDYEKADEALNAAYRKTMARAQAADKDLADIETNLAGAVTALKAAQRAWIGYRDGHCALEGFEARGGSMEPMLVSGCLRHLTLLRTEELNAVLAEPQ